MKYFKLLTDNSIFFGGESIFTEPLKNRLLRELSKIEADDVEFEEVTEEYVRTRQYYLITGQDFGDPTGERNVFHDVNGNEYHN